MNLVFPPLYAIISADCFPGDPAVWAERLAIAGAGIIQYRDKAAAPRVVLAAAQRLAALARRFSFRFILNDRPDLAALCQAGGVHLGQDDLPVEAARRICGEACWVGVSTHNLPQLRAAAATSADYMAVGPIFATTTKQKQDPVVGVEFIRQARAMTPKPLVAIGGITAETAIDVFRAGADAVAVAGDLARAGDLTARVQQYLRAASEARGTGRNSPRWS
jgi:thiamine-phosphate pyrophosphorylase